MDNRRTSLSIIHGSADLDIQYFVVGRSPITSNFVVEMDQTSTGVVCVNGKARKHPRFCYSLRSRR